MRAPHGYAVQVVHEGQFWQFGAVLGAVLESGRFWQPRSPLSDTPRACDILAAAVRSQPKGGRPAIHLGRRTLRVVGVRDDDADEPPVLIVADVAGGDAA
jgi:hypothetical protein